MKIKKAAVIGLGALGTLYSDHLCKHMPEHAFTVIASKDRIEKYKKNGVSINGVPLHLDFTSPEDSFPVDLIIFATKFPGLASAIKDARNFVGENTLVISFLNGISSEEMLADAYGEDKVLYCVAYGMSAVKLGNNLETKGIGTLSIGEVSGEITPKLKRLIDFFEETDIKYDLPNDILFQQWSKFMLNVGSNQTCAAFGIGFYGIQESGEARDTVIAAMREALTIANAEGIALTNVDVEKWLGVADGLDPQGMPSMRQDLVAGRMTEVDLFSGTIRLLGAKHNIATPVNDMLYERIRLLEKDL